MGRKIPGRKHRGVKDPEKQRLQRLNSIRDKINAPPTNPDDQQIPKSLSRIIELKKKVKDGLYAKKRNKNLLRNSNNAAQNPKQNANQPSPQFVQHPGETDRAFLNRVNIICQNVTKEAAFADKYGIDIKRNEHGEVEKIVKRPKDELELLVKKIRKEKKDKKSKKKKKEPESEKLTKAQKWKLKKTAKKLKKTQKNIDGFAKYEDNVKFGEIVHAPPSLIAPKKSNSGRGSQRPGTKELILKSMLHTGCKTEGTEQNVKQSIVRNKVQKNTITIDKKGKRRDLPHALRRQLDKQQKEVVEAYKLLKTKGNRTS